VRSPNILMFGISAITLKGCLVFAVKVMWGPSLRTFIHIFRASGASRDGIEISSCLKKATTTGGALAHV